MKKLLVVLVLVLGLLAVMATAVIVITPRVTRLDPVKVAGDALTGYGANSDRHKNARQLPTPWDPVGDANRRVEAIPMEDRAYPLIAEAAAMLEAADVGDLLRNRPGDEGWSESVEWITSDVGQSIVTMIERATRKSELGVPISDAPDAVWEDARQRHGLTRDRGTESAYPMLLNVRLTPLAASRRMTALLLIDAENAVANGDRDLFAHRLTQCLHLAGFRSELITTIEVLVSWAVVDRVNATIESVLISSPGFIDAEMATQLADSLDHLDSDGSLSLVLQSEVMMLEDVLRRFVSRDGSFNATLAQSAVQAMESGGLANTAPSSVVRDSLNEDVLDAIRAVESWNEETERRVQPPFRSAESLNDEVDRYANEPSSIPGRMVRMVIGLVNPPYDQLMATSRRANQEFTALRLALAAHRHRLRHGDPPLGLADIDDDLIAFDPVDGFTGGPMQFRWRDGAPFVYTYGPDKDDDGGRHVLNKDGEPWDTISDELLESAPDGDFVLFPSPIE